MERSASSKTSNKVGTRSIRKINIPKGYYANLCKNCRHRQRERNNCTKYPISTKNLKLQECKERETFK